jgi:hypothetical protein
MCVGLKRRPTRMKIRKKEIIRSYDELPDDLTIPDIAAILKVSKVRAFQMVWRRGLLTIPRERFIEWIDMETERRNT